MDKNIAIMASGNGSNAINIYNYFKAHNTTSSDLKVNVKLILCNKADAPIVQKANDNNIPVFIITKEEFLNSNKYITLLQNENIDLIVLAGFLWQVPSHFINAFANKIINIHPALLPKFGGKGMYGDHIHKAVLEQKEKQTGITIHYANEHYDEGEIIFQQGVDITNEDDLASLKAKIQTLEQSNYPSIIKDILFKQKT